MCNAALPDWTYHPSRILATVSRLPPKQPCRYQMPCVKRVREPLMARDFLRQLAKFQLGGDVHNDFTAPDIPVTKFAAQVPAAKDNAGG